MSKDGFFQLWKEPVKDEDLTPEKFKIYTRTEYPALLKYVEPEKIARKRKEIYTATTQRSFILHVLKNCIKWNVIKELIQTKVQEIYQKVQCQSLIQEIGADLAKINLEFRELVECLPLILHSDEKDIKKVMENFIVSNQRCDGESVWEDINTMSFNYLKKDFLQRSLQKVDSANLDYFVIKKFSGEKWIVKPEFGNVRWLNYYAKEDLETIFQNTMVDKVLATFVIQQFKFKELVADIFKTCVSSIQKIDSWSAIQLYQQVARETNDLIGMANNDLQQVSYRLNFKLVGEIHLQMVYLIWKYFEEEHWKKITKPLEEMKNRKEQQREFFKSVASSDDKRINKAEAEKMSGYIEEYTKNLIQSQKEEVIKTSVDNFKKQTKRSKIQDQLDAHYFSRNSMNDNDDLYSYILNPRDVILKAYEDASESFCQDLENQIQSKNKPINDFFSELISRIIKIQTALNHYSEDFWTLHNIFEFKRVQVLSQDEVLIKKHSSKIGEFYYKIILAFLEGDIQNIFKEYEINSQLKVVLRKLEGLEVSPLENQEISKLLRNLGNKPGNVTNAMLFIDNLLKQVEELKRNCEKLFNFSAEDLKEFKDKSNIFVCKQKCPCCDRICGEEDPNHKNHRCLYGHQIRAIGGTMIDTQEASIARCEDISDLDKMIYNGQDMTWGAFKEKMKEKPNNPWIFDDILKTRKDKFLREKFELAWTLIGKRICQERHRESGMKFVPFNQATIDAQKVKSAKPSNYIFMIDSSSSMKGERWDELKVSLKTTLGKISFMNPNSSVSIINFSSEACIAYKNAPANSISVDVIDFYCRGTNFSTAFAAGFELLKEEKQNNIVLLFMTDGEAPYPTEEINSIKTYISSSQFTDLGIKFSFNGIGFKIKKPKVVNSIFKNSLKLTYDDPKSVLDKLVADLGGTHYFADSGAELTKTYIEILNKKDI